MHPDFPADWLIHEAELLTPLAGEQRHEPEIYTWRLNLPLTAGNGPGQVERFWARGRPKGSNPKFSPLHLSKQSDLTAYSLPKCGPHPHRRTDRSCCGQWVACWARKAAY